MKGFQEGLSPDIYDTSYFFNHCGGFEEYQRSMGKELDIRLGIVFNLARIKGPLKVLDIGCGRGELVLHAATKGAMSFGIDYSKDAISISCKTLEGLDWALRGNAHICRAEASFIPFKSGSFDRIILSDIVEHLPPEEVRKVFCETWRLLKKEGILVIHTFPNRWFYDIYYPLLRIFRLFFCRERWPSDPRTLYERKMHINEQSPISLLLNMRRYFRTSIWVCHRDRMKEKIKKGKLPGLNPFSLFIEPEMWALAIKR